MTVAGGVLKKVGIKKESTWGTAAGASGGYYLRRVTSDLGLEKDKYESNEIRSDYQRNDMRHGVRSIKGSINGELSAGTYKDLMAAAVRKAFTAVSAITSLSLTMATSGAYYTITRGSGSWISDGVKVGDVVRITAGSVDALNSNKNFFVLVETATVLTVTPLNGSAMTAEGPIASCTVAVTGKKAYVPTTGHTDDSFTIEHWFSDISQSELFTGCKIDQMDIALPPTGLATGTFQFMGKDVTTADSQYFSSPTAVTSTGALAAVNGVLIAQGGAIALVTGLNFSLKANMSAEAVVGSNTYGFITPGRVLVDGQLTAVFADATLRDYFINETEVQLAVALTASGAAAADFICFSLPRIKFSGGKPNDNDKTLILTMPFDALIQASAGGAGTVYEASTLVIQDSQA